MKRGCRKALTCIARQGQARSSVINFGRLPGLLSGKLPPLDVGDVKGPPGFGDSPLIAPLLQKTIICHIFRLRRGHYTMAQGGGLVLAILINNSNFPGKLIFR